MEQNRTRITAQMLRARLVEQLSGPSAGSPEIAPDYSQVELLLIPEDGAFVAEAYRRVLGREPDLDGVHHFVGVLQSHSRQVVIDALEAARPAAPASPPPAEDGQGPTDLTPLDQIEAPEEFVNESYRRILRREADTAGMAHYRTLLASGVPRIQVLASIAASKEGRTRNTPFLWNGNILPPPRLSLAMRFWILLCRLTGLSELVDGMSAMRVELRALRARLQALDGGIQALSTNVQAAQVGMEKKCDALSSQAQRVPDAGSRELAQLTRLVELRLEVQNRLLTDLRDREHTQQEKGGAAAAQWHADLDARMAALLEQLDAVARDIRDRQAGFQSGQDRARAEATSAAAQLRESFDARVDGLLEKLDAISGDIRDRQEGVQSLQNLGRAEAGAAAAQLREGFDARVDGLLEKLDAIAADIRARQEGVQSLQNLGRAEAAAAAAQLREGFDARADGLLEKLDAIAADVRDRQEGVQSEVHQGIAGLRDQAGLIALSLRPPVLIGSDLLVTKVNDFILAIPRNDLSSAAHYAYWGALDLGLTRCLAGLLRPGDVFVDVGANIGIHSLEAARAVGEKGRVYSFEPTPEAFAALRKNLELNEMPRVETFQCAVLDRPGPVPLYLNTGMSGLNSLFGESGRESILVEGVTLDEALRGRESVHVVKIDAEGAEPFIWRGMAKVLAANPKLVVLLEFAATHLRRAGIDPPDFLRELKAAGFEIRQIHDLTGELTGATDDQILNNKSTNLYLQRPVRE